MKKIAVSRIGKSLALLLLLSSSLPFSLAYAETVEEVPTSETTISTMADDPLKDKTESTTDHVPTIEESDKEETKTTTSETASTEETKTTESSTEDATKKKPKPKPFGGGIGPQTVNLIEGVDIDADFAQVLRTDKLTTNGGGAWSGFGKAQDQLTDDDMADLHAVDLFNKGLTSVLGIEYAVNLIELNCNRNTFVNLDMSRNLKLQRISCDEIGLTTLNVDGLTDLVVLSCSFNELTNLDLSTNIALQQLSIQNNQFTTVDVSNNINLRNFACQSNKISTLNVNNNIYLELLECHTNQLTSLNLVANTALKILYCQSNKLTGLDVTSNILLEVLNCEKNPLGVLNLSANALLKELECNLNQLSNLDLSFNTGLITLGCYGNQLSSLDLSSNTSLKKVYCFGNNLTNLASISSCQLLQTLDCRDNLISDITSTNNLTNLTYLRATGQRLTMSVPAVSFGGQASVDILKTTGHTGLTATNGDISPTPSFTYSGDNIILSNVTRASLSDKYINFSYDGTQLTEGAASGTKSFSGTITFFNASDLVNELSANKKKVNSGDEVDWTWKITSTSVKKAEDVHATLDLPAGWVVDPSSITKNGSPATMSDIDGTNSHGDMDTGDVITFTFKTTASGNADEWLDVKGRLDWKDDTITSPYDNESKVSIQILDEEQTYTPKDSNDIALQSVPISFDYGSHHVVSSSAQTHHLGAANYQSNTNVVTDGFYTRVKDDRTTSTGWKLTAKLSEFRDSGNQVMPNGAGTSLKLENMTIERVTDRDTPQEVIDPTPSGADVPSSVTATETLVAGQATAKTLVHAQVNEGRETWQLRMPLTRSP